MRHLWGSCSLANPCHLKAGEIWIKFAFFMEFTNNLVQDFKNIKGNRFCLNCSSSHFCILHFLPVWGRWGPWKLTLQCINLKHSCVSWIGWDGNYCGYTMTMTIDNLELQIMAFMIVTFQTKSYESVNSIVRFCDGFQRGEKHIR